MFDIGALELLMIVVVAIIVIGPKDMPAALRVVGRWVGKLRSASAQFRAGFDNIVREAEMEDMEKKWKEQNAKIMAETPEGEMGPLPSANAESAADANAAPLNGAPEDLIGDLPAKPSSSGTDAEAKKVSTKAGKPKADEPMLPLGKPDEE